MRAAPIPRVSLTEFAPVSIPAGPARLVGRPVTPVLRYREVRSARVADQVRIPPCTKPCERLLPCESLPASRLVQVSCLRSRQRSYQRHAKIRQRSYRRHARQGIGRPRRSGLSGWHRSGRLDRRQPTRDGGNRPGMVPASHGRTAAPARSAEPPPRRRRAAAAPALGANRPCPRRSTERAWQRPVGLGKWAPAAQLLASTSVLGPASEAVGPGRRRAPARAVGSSAPRFWKRLA